MNSRNSNEIRPLGDQYLEWMAYTHKSSTTITVRKRHLKYFFDWCEQRSLLKPEDFSRPVIERYQKYLFYYRKKDLAPLSISSQLARLIAVREFFKHLARERIIIHNPASDIIMPRKSQRLPGQVFTAQEVENIMTQPDVNTHAGIRDRAILELFYSTGIRRFELVNLTLYDYDVQREVIIIIEGKGRKDRIVPIGKRAAVWLQKYIGIREFFLGKENQYIFLSKYGERIALATVSENMRNYIKSSGIIKKGACHIFRHTMATLMLENGADIRYIQQMLGHANLSTTQVYTRVSIKQLKAVHSLTHPASKPVDAKAENCTVSKSEPPTKN